MKWIIGMLLGASIFMLNACGGEDLIFFVNIPKSGFSGKNIIHEELSNLDSTEDYSLIVQLDRDMTYKVVFNNLSEKLPVNTKDSLASVWNVVSANQNTGWFVFDYDYNEQSQTFIAEGPVSAHMSLKFTGCGKMRVDIYETGNKKLTESKTVSWESFCDP
ncbi:MAG: hypothetical protein ACPGLV_05365 [Bacteroidia bacterium]